MQAPLQARNDDAAQTDAAKTVSRKWGLEGNRPEELAQYKLAEMANNSPRVLQQLALNDGIRRSPRMVPQLHEINVFFCGTDKLQGDAAMPAEPSPAQREEKTNNAGLPNQLKSGITQRIGVFPAPVINPNNTGLPHQLKAGVEAMSGISMDSVKVHYNSSQPAQINAHAYAQGTNIHLGPGQEKHLPHEVWHVVQQAQGRVQATAQVKGRTLINDDVQLEREADEMGTQAAQFSGRISEGSNVVLSDQLGGVIQGWFYKDQELTEEYTQEEADALEKLVGDHPLYWENDVYIPLNSSKEEAEAALQNTEDRKNEEKAIKAAKEASEIEALTIKGGAAKSLADAAAEKYGGQNVVGSAYKTYLPTQDHINWSKVKHYIDKIESGSTFDTEISEVDGKKSLTETHHRFVACMLTKTPIIESISGEAVKGFPDWSSTAWTGWDGNNVT